MQIKKYIKKYFLLIILSLLVVIIYCTPHYYFNIFEKKFNGIIFSPADAELHYLSIVKEVKEGHLSHTSTYLQEYKNSEMPLFHYSEIVCGIFIKVLHINVDTFYLISKFVFTFVNFLFFYYFVFLVSKNSQIALLSSLSLFLGKLLLDPSIVGNIFSIIFWQTDNYSLLPYSRFVNPLLTYPFLFFGLIRVVKFYKKPTTKNAVYLGLALGISFYIYFYFWFYLFTVSGVLLLYYIFKRKWSSVKKISWSFLIAFFIGSYFLLEMKEVFFGGVTDQTEGALNVFTHTRHFIFSKIIVSTLVLFLIYLGYKKYKKIMVSKNEIFIIVLLLSSILVVNQQVLSGVLIEEGHFHWYINRAIVFLVLSYIFVNILNIFIKKELYKKIIVSFVFLFLIVFGIGVQVSGYKARVDVFVGYNKYGGVIDWLNNNSLAESVILANDDLSELIPAYTNNNVYYAPHAIFYPTNPLERRKQAVYVYYALQNGRDLMSEASANYLCKKYVYFLYNYGGKQSECPEKIKDDIIDEYNKDIVPLGMKQILTKYQIDYIIWDKNKEPEWQVDKFNFVKEEFSDGDVVLFKVD